MRRLLMSTVLVSACLLALPAQADMAVTVGGYTGFQAALFDNDLANSSGRDFQSESEIHVRAKGTADNGLEYGVLIELMTSTT